MAGCSGCGSVKGNKPFSLVRGSTKRRAVTYTRYADKVQVPLDASDFTARLVIRKNSTAPDVLLELTEGDGITLTTVDGSIRIYILVPASVTSTLPTGKGFHQTLVLEGVTDPDDVTVIVNDNTVSVTDTSL